MALYHVLVVHHGCSSCFISGSEMCIFCCCLVNFVLKHSSRELMDPSRHEYDIGMISYLMSGGCGCRLK